MEKNPSITLGDQFESFVSTQVQSGGYGSASEVIRSTLQLLENQEAKLHTLLQLLIESEQSGDADYDLISSIKELFSKRRVFRFKAFSLCNAALYGCFVAPAEKQFDNSALLQFASIVAYCYN